jgi:phosphopantothenoylcysteine decarboxylase/phosphopantothenate--cysteine ligase
MYNLTDRRIVLGATGSIAVYKAVDLTSKLTQAGAAVDVLMTPEATKFVAPITFQSVSGRRVYWDMWDAHSDAAEPHVALARSANIMVVAPATATMTARLALGLAEDMVSLTALACTAPLVVCPAMDANMFEHAATQGHLKTLIDRGVRVIGPEEGRLASGQMGRGRLSEVETIIGGIRHVLGADGDLAGKKVVVSAGGTHEPIDPVRFVGNRSSGKMGFALAEAARDRGAKVALISGPTALADPVGIEVIRVERAADMRNAVVRETGDASALIMAAAVADYQPAEAVGEKIKRGDREGITLSLVRTPDILADVGPRPGLVKVGFAAESQDLHANARQKIVDKGLDLIVANDITASDAGFSVDTNRVVIMDPEGGQEELPLMSKYDAAWRILDRVVALLASR